MTDQEQEQQNPNAPHRSIWDEDVDDEFDQDLIEEQDRVFEAQQELDRRNAEVNKGWFGGDYQDFNDSRWGAQRTYDPDSNGLPRAQRPDDKAIKRGSYRHTDKIHKTKTKIKRDLHKKPTYKRYKAIKDAPKKRKKKIRHWIFGEPKRVYHR